MRSRPCTPRLFVCADLGAVSVVLVELRAAGWSSTETATQLDARSTCSTAFVAGTVAASEIVSLVELLSRSISIVAHVPQRAVAVELWDQGRRLAEVEWFDEQHRPICDGLDLEQVALLRALAAGATVNGAAAACHLSHRTAARRLTAARAALGAASNGEAALIVAGRLDRVAPDR